MSPRLLSALWPLLSCGALLTPALPVAQARSPAATEPASQVVSARRELVAAVFQWLAATNRRDFAAQARFYPERMEAFYLWRDVARADVLAEKRKVFERAASIDIQADAPQIIVAPDARSARMYFRKSYSIDGVRRDRRGEVLQELRWEKQADGWKIVSERDLRVIRQARARAF